MSAAISPEQLYEQQFEARLARRRQKKLFELGDDAVAMLAFVPIWTDALAHECKFPTGDGTLADWLEAAQAASICETHAYSPTLRNERERAELMVALAPYLDELQRAELRDAIQAIPERTRQAELLNALIPTLDAIRPSRFGPLYVDMMPVEVDDWRGFGPLWFQVFKELDEPIARDELRINALPLVSDLERSLAINELFASLQELQDETTRARLLILLAPHLNEAQLTRAQSAGKLAPFGLKLAQDFENVSLRAQVAYGFAAQAKMDEGWRVIFLKNAAVFAQQIENGEERSRLLGQIATALASNGDGEAAQETAELVSNEPLRAQAFGAIAQIYSERGDTSLARSARVRATELAQALPDPIERAACLGNLAAMWTPNSALGAPRQDTQALAAGARDIVVQIPARIELVNLYGNLAQTLFALDMTGDARAILDRARDILQKLDDPAERCQMLLALLPYTRAIPDARDFNVNDILNWAPLIVAPETRQQILIGALPFANHSERPFLVKQILNPLPPLVEFWMPEAKRVETLATLAGTRGAQELRALLQGTARRIFASSQHVAAPVISVRWAKLANAVEDGKSDIEPYSPESGQIARVLDDRIIDVLERRDTRQATGWLDAGAILAQAMRGELDDVVLLGKRRVELVYRQIQDERQLAGFLPRQEQLDAFEQLITPDSPFWALHYIGMGGVGKTMLLRHLMQIAREKKFPAARIDFDHISPDFPVRRPGMLLLGLMDELQAQATELGQETLAREFRERVVSLHEATSETGDANNPLANLRTRGFERVLLTFCDFLKRMPQPALLILDTCEELAKLQPDGVRLPGVEATFEIMERVRERIPWVRVIFAGRRFLTSSGFGWRINPQDQRAATLQIEPKEYLALYEIRGFDETEANTFLRNIKRLPLTDEMKQAILTRSPEAGTVTPGDKPIVYDPPRASQEITRYNPYALALYADWLRETPSLKSQEITSGETDPYVERRIVARIHNDAVRRALPLIALLGRFDRALLEPLYAPNVGLAQDVFDELRALEWIDNQNEFLEVDRNLRPALLKFFEKQRGENPEAKHLDEAKRAVTPWLDQQLTDAHLEDLTADQVVAALRILSGARAAELWTPLSFAIAHAANWNWALNITSRVLDPENEFSAKHPARAQIRATYIAALLHTQRDYDATEQWKQVEQDAADEPNATTRAWLLQRASFGRIAAAQFNQRELSAEQEKAVLATIAATSDTNFTSVHSEWSIQLFASVLAAFEGLVERAEEIQTLPNVLHSIQELHLPSFQADSIPRELRTFAQILLMRACVFEKDINRAADLFNASYPDEPVEIELSSAQNWMDWRTPDFLSDRIGLELARLLPVIAPAKRNALFVSAEAIDNIDTERLASALIQSELTQKLADIQTLELFEKLNVYDPERKPQVYAHRITPPLFVSVAMGWLALGNAARALNLLDDRIRLATQAANDPLTIREAERAKLHVYRRMRLNQEPTLVDRYAASKDPQDIALALPLIALTRASDSEGSALPQTFLGLRDGEPTDPQTLHAVLRSQVGHTHVFSTQSAIEGTGNFIAVSIAFDVREDNLLHADSTRIELPHFDPEAWLQEHPVEIENATRLMLRQHALDARVKQTEKAIERWAIRVGARKFAELALDEGEMLALRLPKRATTLLELSRTWFYRANDSVGQAVAENLMAWAVQPRPELPSSEQKYVAETNVQNLWTYVGLLFSVLGLVCIGSCFLITRFSEVTSELPFASRIVAYGLTLAGLVIISALMYWLALYVGRASAASGQARIEILGVSNIEVSRRGTIVLQERPVELRLGIPPWSIGTLHGTSGTTARFRELLDYRSSSTRIDPTVADKLRALQKRVGNHSLVIPLTLAPEAEPIAWEAILLYETKREAIQMELSKPALTRAMLGSFQFYRRGQGVQAPTFINTPIVQIFASERWSAYASPQWHILDMAPNASMQVVARQFTAPSAPPLIYHIIGATIETNAGLQMQIDRAEFQAMQKSAQGSAMRSTQLFSPDNFGAPNVALVIVQAEPFEIHARVDTEREQMQNQRAFAAQVFHAGARSVLLLPPLPPALGELVIHEIASTLKKFPAPTIEQLLALSARVRRSIVEWKNPEVSERASNLSTSEKQVLVEKQVPRNEGGSLVTRTWGMSADEKRALLEVQFELALEVTLWARPLKLESESRAIIGTARWHDRG